MQFPKIFEPVSIGKIEIKNRVSMAPMGIVGLTEPDGNPSPRAIEYYIERARGGAGLIITSVFKVENQIEGNKHAMHSINNASSIPFGELSEAVHALGCKIFVQLTAGFGRVAPMRILNSAPVSASVVPSYHDSGIFCRPLEIQEIEQIIQAFGNAAAILASSGIDGVELHGHEGYLLDQFTTSIWNKRTDKYGGDLKQRLTFPVEVLREIKQKAGKDFVVQYRFGLKHNIKGLNSGGLPGEMYNEAGRDINEGLEMAVLLEHAGFDSLHVDAGCYDSWYWAHPPGYQKHGCMAEMAALVKKVVKIPVVAVGRIDVPELAEKIIENGEADIIAIGRGLLADAFWPQKVAMDRTAEIRPCIGCHDGCIGRFLRGRPLSCAVNPACGREREYELKKSQDRKKVVVVGGGAAGMEAARISALRGHDVVLYEKNELLGGHLIEASVPDFKKDLSTLLEWYTKQLEINGVQVVTGKTISTGMIQKDPPDALVIATGSVPSLPDIPGINLKQVITCIDILRSPKTCGENVVVVGGGLTGCETALWLAQQGKKVKVVEMLSDVMTSGLPVPQMNRTMLLDLFSLYNVRTIKDMSVSRIVDGGIILSASEDILMCDTVVIATGLKSDDALYKSLLGKIPLIYSCGDCQQPRNIMAAIWDGFEIGRAI